MCSNGITHGDWLLLLCNSCNRNAAFVEVATVAIAIGIKGSGFGDNDGEARDKALEQHWDAVSRSCSYVSCTTAEGKRLEEEADRAKDSILMPFFFFVDDDGDDVAGGSHECRSCSR